MSIIDTSNTIEYFTEYKSDLFTNAYAITLDTNAKRYVKIKSMADAAGIPLQPFNGIRIKDEDIPSLPLQGVGTTHYSNRKVQNYNLGVIGAFLAHRRLLEHIHTTDANGRGTLIFEDDVRIPQDFYQQLNARQAEIPEDWDYIFLCKANIKGQKISEHVMKLEKDMSGLKNHGFWAFIVKNSSIAERILPYMEHMLDVPDIQMAKYADKVNMYYITPEITRPDEETLYVSDVSRIDAGRDF